MAFETYLSECLNTAGLDGDVYGEYISGTLGTLESSSVDEVEESLLEILQGCVEDDLVCKNLCKEILHEWIKEKEKNKESNCETEQEADFTLQQGNHAHQQGHTHRLDGTSVRCIPKESGKVLSAEEKRRLIAQYDCESDEEPPAYPEARQRSREGVFLNDNAAVVDDVEKQHREKMKAEHEVRMDRQRQDRENQKQKAQDRKEKEKKRTQKQEKRR